MKQACSFSAWDVEELYYPYQPRIDWKLLYIVLGVSVFLYFIEPMIRRYFKKEMIKMLTLFPFNFHSRVAGGFEGAETHVRLRVSPGL